MYFVTDILAYSVKSKLCFLWFVVLCVCQLQPVYSPRLLTVCYVLCTHAQVHEAWNEEAETLHFLAKLV